MKIGRKGEKEGALLKSDFYSVLAKILYGSEQAINKQAGRRIRKRGELKGINKNLKNEASFRITTEIQS